MIEKQLKRGDILFDVGERSVHVFLVLDGSVEILKNNEGRTETVGVASRGDFISEFSTIIDRSQVTAARVSSESARIRQFSKEEFFQYCSSDPKLAYGLINRLGEKLYHSKRRSSDNKIITAIRSAESFLGSQKEEPKEKDNATRAKLTIFPHSEALSHQIPSDGIVVMTSPFIVGRKLKNDEDGQLLHTKGHRSRGVNIDRRSNENDRRATGGTDNGRVHLQLEDKIPYRISRVHFLLQTVATGGFIIRDLGSTLGTRVNDTYLGVDFPSVFIKLDAGEHIIAAGGKDSPYVFRVTYDAR